MSKPLAPAVVIALGLALSGCATMAPREEAVEPPPTELPAPPAVVAPAPAADSESDVPRRFRQLASSELGIDTESVGYFMDVQQARLTQVGGAQLSLQRDGNRITLNLPGRLNFEVGSAALSANGSRALSEVASILAEFRSTLIVLHGHTDDTGSVAGNQRLSERRAQAVANLLKQSGVEGRRILAIGHGASRPLLPNINDASREINRRVQLVLEPLVRPAAETLGD